MSYILLKEKFGVNVNYLKNMSSLGNGSGGYVYLYTVTSHLFFRDELKFTEENYPKKVVIKHISNMSWYRFKEEASNHKILSSQDSKSNFLTFYEALWRKDQGIIIMEYIENSITLDNYVPKSSKDILNVATEIIKGIIVMHSNKIAHLDLKTSNLLLTPDGIVKIIDFGSSIKVNEDEKEKICLKEPRTTVWFSSPEQLLFNQFYHSYDKTDILKQDIWSIGVIIFFMYCQIYYTDKGKYMKNNCEKGQITEICKIINLTKSSTEIKEVLDHEFKNSYSEYYIPIVSGCENLENIIKNKVFYDLISFILVFKSSDRPTGDDILLKLSLLIQQNEELENKMKSIIKSKGIDDNLLEEEVQKIQEIREIQES